MGGKSLKIKSLKLMALGIAIAILINLINLPAWVTAQPINSNPNNKPELRGIWLTNVDSDVLLSRDRLAGAIERLQKLNFNTIYPTVWHEGYTLYPSAIAAKSFGKAQSPEPGLQGRDMLAEAIALGHAKGLAVMPWFEFGLMSEERADLSTRYPGWLTTRKDGSSVFVYGDRGQHRFVWLNPLRPEVQQLIVDLIVEVVSKYDVDGIQLDDHFGMPVELGYDDYTIAQYQKDHNGKRPPNDHKDPEWLRWRSHYVTDLMVKIFTAVKTVKPNCLISLSPNPKDFSYQNYLQDWHRWVQLGLIDQLIIQVYRSDLAGFKKELERRELVEVRQKIPVGIGILTGLRVQNVDIKQIEDQVKTTRDLGFQGFSFFFYETLGDRDLAFQTLLGSTSDRS